MTTPIFVLGLQRSGTTWMGNLLASHPDVASVSSADHSGIHESIFFSHFAREYGDLTSEANFARFAADFAACDYYVLTGIEEDWLWRRRPRSYPEAFRELMEELARRRGARFWVEKSPHHTLLAEQLAEWFPDARFVCMVRSPLSLIRSRLWAYGRRPAGYPRRLAMLVRACAVTSLYQRYLRTFTSSCERSILIPYEALSRDLPGECARIAEFLGVGFDPDMLVEIYPANTSFRGPRERSAALGRTDVLLVRMAMALLRLVPLRLFHRIEQRRREHRGVEWPGWCWKRRPRTSHA